MSTISCTIRGNTVTILADTSGSTIGGNATGMSGGSSTTTLPTITAAVEVRDVLKLTVIDASGTAVYYRGDPVVLTDSVSGVLYSGYVQTSDPTKLSPDPASTTTFHTITCMDKQYLFDKRTNNLPYLNIYAGDIAVDLVRRVGALEGVTVAAAMDRDTVQADFAAGTLAGTVATSNVGDGDLELVAAGSGLTISEQTTAVFATGTLVGVTASGNWLVPTTQQAMFLSARLPIDVGDDALYVQFWSGSQAIGVSDTLNYDIWIGSTSPGFMAGIDLLLNDGSTLHTYTGPADQNYLPAAITTDLSGYAKDTWYTRTITLASLSGKSVTGAFLAIESNSVGTYSVYVKNVFIGSHSGTPLFATNATVTNVNPPTPFLYAGFLPALFVVSVVPVLSGAFSYRISPAYSIDAVKLVRSSQISWGAAVPAKASVTVAVSYDGNAFALATNGAPLPGLPAGSNVAGLSLYLLEILAVGSDPTLLPSLNNVQITLTSAASATATGITGYYGNATEWNTGTLAGVSVNGAGDLTLGTLLRNWNDTLISNQTFFQVIGSSASQSASGSKYAITVPVSAGGAYVAISRFDFAGTAQNFVLEWDMTQTGTNSLTGLMYRTAGWTPTYDLNFGYFVEVYCGSAGSGNYIMLGYGSNSNTATTIGTWTQLALVYTTVTSGTQYHYKLVVQGNLHQVFFNNATSPTISIVDATYPGGGEFGARVVGGGSSTGGTTVGSYDNFSLTPSSSGSWKSPSVSISSLGTTGGSSIAWLETLASGASSSTAVVQTSLDGGSTWQTATNGATIPGLTAGTSVSGKSLLVAITLVSATVVGQPVIGGVFWRVLGVYPGSTGTRVAPVLSLSPAVRAGATSVAWNANLPTGTTLVVASSPDNITYTTIAASGNPIASIYSQPAPQIDVFTTNTLANYTNTFKSGGSVATVTYTTASSLLTLAGGSGAVYLFTAISRADVDLICDMDRSDAGGLVWRYVNNLNYYELGIYDDSSSGGYTSQARLYKVAAGVRSLLGVASPIVFPRSTPGQSPYQRTHVTMAGAVISVFYEGVLVQSYTDGSPLAAGQMGLRNDGGTSRYYQLRLQPLGDLMTGQNLYIKETLTTSDPAMMPQLLDLTASVRGPGLATGALIPQLHAPTVPIAEFLNTEMNTITTASGDYYWNINSSGSTIGALSFVERHAVPAPWCLFSTDLIYEANVTPTSTSDLYRNRQNITNCTGVTALLHEQMITDGSASSWKTLNPIYSAPLISVQGIAQNVGVQSVDTGKQFYWTANSTSFGQDAAAVKLPAGYIIDIYYVGQFITTVTVDNATEQTARAAVEVGTSGIIEASENGNGMLASAATTYANGLLARYGLNNAVQVIAATQRAGLAPGMLLPVFLPEHSLGNAQMLVTGVNTTMQQQADGSVLYFYQITATQGSNLANWTKVFGF